MDSTAQWNEDFSHRPSWCDAKMAMKQIKRGNAKGNRAALCVRSLLQRLLFRVGCFIQKHYGEVLFAGILIMLLFCLGLRLVKIETDVVKLWVQKGGRLNDELSFLERIKEETERLAAGDSDMGASVTPETGLSGGFQVVISTPRKEGDNILNQRDLLLHADVLTNVSQLTVEAFGERWGLSDLCFKPPAPQVELGSMTDLVQMLLDKIIPCVIITPLDCFWEGSKPLGPFPPIDLGSELSLFLPSLPSGPISWKNLHPMNVIRDVGGMFDLGMVRTLFERAGIKGAYQDRPCIDPLDPECPSPAPDAEKDFCKIVEAVVEARSGKTRARTTENSTAAAPPPATTTTAAEKDEYDDYYDYEGEGGDLFGSLFGGGGESEGKSKVCREHEEGVREELRARPELAEFLLPEGLRPRAPEFGRVMTGGCKAFASQVLNWPEDLIVGGIQRRGGGPRGDISKAEALQSVLMVSSPQDVFVRFKHGHTTKPRLNKHEWTKGRAQEILDMWQRNFTELVYNWPNNTDGDGRRQVHPLASTSVGDMMEEFSQFKFHVIIIGYLVMLCYCAVPLISCKERGVQSCAGLGVAGVLLVTLASASGLGCTTVLGIHFNAATTQIVPFLALGLGVNDMFLLVFSYQEIVSQTNGHQLGFLLKETGLSVLLTSINNILAFLAGSLLPVPALRSFCLQTAILLLFNLMTILTIFPAIMAIDLRRREKKRVDILCCIRINQDKIHPPVAGGGKGRMSNGAVGLVGACLGPRSRTDSTDAEAPPPSYDAALANGALPAPGPHPPKSPAPTGCRDFLGISHWTLHHFVGKCYAPLLQKMAVKVGVVLFFLCLLGFGAVGLTRVKLGLELTDLIPKGTAPYAFLEARERYFSFFPVYAIVKGPVDFPQLQRTIQDYREAIRTTGYTVDNRGSIGDKYWLSMMGEWLGRLEVAYDAAREVGHIKDKEGVLGYAEETSEEAKIAYKLICNSGPVVDCSRNGQTRLLDKDGFINKEGFYSYLTAWYNLDPMMYYISQASLYPLPPKWSNEGKEWGQRIPPAPSPVYSQIPFFLNGLVDTPHIVEAITEIRAVCDAFAAKGLPNFPQGIPFTFGEQYILLKQNVLVCVGIILGCVFLVVTLLLMSPWTAAVVISMLLMIVVELAGFMGWAQIKLNPVSAVNLITAVGLGVEFTVHISLSYLTNMGTRNERMRSTLEHMFIPVLHGGMSTLLGIIMLSFSEFEFIVHYFFLVLSGLIVIGLMNGLLLLPVLLSLVGPRSEVQTTDGTHYLPPPSPSRKRRFGRQKASVSLSSGHGFSPQHSNASGAAEAAELVPAHLLGADGSPTIIITGAGAAGLYTGTSPNGLRRPVYTRNLSGGGGVHFRRHESLSTIDEESTPPSSTTPPVTVPAAGGTTVHVSLPRVVVQTGAAPAPSSSDPAASSRQRRQKPAHRSSLQNVRLPSASSSQGSSPSPPVTVKAKAQVKVEMHHRSHPQLPSQVPSSPAASV